MKTLPLISSVIEFIGKVIFVVVLIPVFEYKAVVWCVMLVQLAVAFYGNSYIKNKKNLDETVKLL